MKFSITILLILVTFLFVGMQCRKENLRPGCYKGRLEIKGVCMNYTIKVMQGTIDTSLFQINWTDPNTNTIYQNVFALGSVCDFPADIVQGDEFYFTINNYSPQNCAVCQAYYPTPQKKLSITVSRSPCN